METPNKNRRQVIIHARNEDALRNGSFIVERIRGKKRTLYQYMNGDGIGPIDTLPDALQQADQQWTLRDAKRIMPRGI